MFQSYVFLPDEDSPVETTGDNGSSDHAMKVLLSSSSNSVTTYGNGLASLSPSTGGLARPLEIEITVIAGGGRLEFELPMLPAAAISPGASTGRARTPAKGKTKPRVERGSGAIVTLGAQNPPQKWLFGASPTIFFQPALEMPDPDATSKTFISDTTKSTNTDEAGIASAPDHSTSQCEDASESSTVRACDSRADAH